MTQLATNIFYYGYTAMLLGVGASGIFIAQWELSRLFAVDLAGMGSEPAATLLTQYRFLKSTELVFGLFCWLFRHAIFAGGEARRLFFIGLFGGVGARLFSLITDGRPHWIFLLFAALELICGLLMLALGPQRGRAT